MCNIAGYAGNKQAAPILIEMLRREAHFDGGFSAGVATIHEGKIHYCKVLGGVEDLVNNTDVLSLPGTIGIAHSRPGGDRIEHAHPFIAPDEKLAMVSNGDTPMDDLVQQRKDILLMLEKEGYDFPYRYIDDSPKAGRLSTGECVGKNYIILAYTQYFLDQGKSFEEAHALAENGMFAENVSVMIKSDVPDMISVCRATRPMEVMINGDETYIATTNFAFPEIKNAVISSLPTLHACNIYAGRYEVTKHRITSHGVCPITPMTYIKAYDYIVKMFKNSSVPLTFHDLQIKLDKEHPDIWHEKHHYTQYAKVVYDILWQLNLESRLNIEIRKHEHPRFGTRDLAYMSLK